VFTEIVIQKKRSRGLILKKFSVKFDPQYSLFVRSSIPATVIPLFISFYVGIGQSSIDELKDHLSVQCGAEALKVHHDTARLSPYAKVTRKMQIS
jgi:hypothetical protein